MKRIFDLGIPVFRNLLRYAVDYLYLGGKVKPAKNRGIREKQKLEITSAEAALFQNTPEKQTVWMSHGDLVTQAPTDFDVVATSKDCPIASIQNARTQNVPESNSMQKFAIPNMEMTCWRHFTLDVCQCTG
ncbi:GMP synthase [Enterococcus hirae]|nr:GMP synthase [Enterococcus hirae]